MSRVPRSISTKGPVVVSTPVPEPPPLNLNPLVIVSPDGRSSYHLDAGLTFERSVTNAVTAVDDYSQIYKTGGDCNIGIEAGLGSEPGLSPGDCNVRFESPRDINLVFEAEEYINFAHRAEEWITGTHTAPEVDIQWGYSERRHQIGMAPGRSKIENPDWPYFYVWHSTENYHKFYICDNGVYMRGYVSFTSDSYEYWEDVQEPFAIDNDGRPMLRSPDGTMWKLAVDDSGNLSTEEVT